ncbi:Sialoadhesin [Anabarilius grahami]|uniref:Sialoadhesin n=1 Tax=Anabarilius grahami TaxID=495550 RepID=A0A3N0Z0E6_ANAGA|nr:Sialoadhesin [Anabarilius grahami]
MVSSLIKSLPLIVVIMTAGVDGQQDWGVNYSPSYVCALKGSRVKISCTLTYPHGHVIRTVFWTKHVVTDGESPDLCSDPEKRGGIQCLSEDEDTSSITLTNVTEVDKHVYYCRFTTNIDGGKWTGIPGVQLDVTDLQVETQQRVAEGDSVTLTCKSSCSLPEQTTFIWYRSRERFTDQTVNQLHLQSVSRSDAGNYRCAVRGNEHLRSPPVSLKVEWVDGLQDWGVNYSPSYVCALKGSTVKISCTLKYPPGHVISTVFWTKPAITNGELPDLRDDQRKRGRVQYLFSEYKNTSSITLTNVTEADKHVYYCRFTTNIDGGKWTGIPGAQLDVTDLQVETQQRVKEGDSVTLTCKSSCSLTEQTTFIWYRNTPRFTKGIVKVNQLHLQTVSHSDEGNYRCAVRGHDHLISPAVYLKVEWVQRAALHTVSGIVAGCGGLIFIIIIFIIVFIKSAETALTNDVPLYSLVSANQRDDLYDDIKPERYGRKQTETDSGDVEEVQYASVHHFKNKDMKKTEENDCQTHHPSEANRDEAHNEIIVSFLIAEVTMVSSLIKSLPLIVVIMTAGVDGQQNWGVNYSHSYVCALKGSTVKISCTVRYPDDHELIKAFWTKTVGESPDLCSDPGKRGRVQCLSEDKDTYSITLVNVREADKHVYYCRFTTNIDGGKWTGIPGVQLDVTVIALRHQGELWWQVAIIGKRKFNDKWLEKDEFSWWLRPVPVNVYEADCAV